MKTKTRISFKVFFLLFFLILAHNLTLSTVLAQAPQQFSYQAVARNGDAVLNDATIDVKFEILQGSLAGSSVWTETHSGVVTNSLGLFSLKPGSITALDDIDWTAGPYFLKVQLDIGTGFQEFGSSELLSVPYALFAAEGNEGPAGPAGPTGPAGPQGEQGPEASDDQQLSYNAITHDLTIDNGITPVNLSGLLDNTDNQDLTLAGTTLNISGGTSADLSSLVNDADADASNELQDLSLNGNVLSLTNDATTVDLGTYADNPWTVDGTNEDSLLFNGYVSVGPGQPNGSRLTVQGSDINDDKPLFEVKRDDGQTVFAVYNSGTRIYVEEGTGKGSSRGGFAVGGFRPGKASIETGEYFRVTSDSVRIYLDDSPGKKSRGGFAVGGFRPGKASVPTGEYFRVTSDSVRIYLDDSPGKKSRGGFAVGGFTPGKGTMNQEYLRVTEDSTRVYVSDSLASGFSVSNVENGSFDNLIDLTTHNYFIGHQSGTVNRFGKYNTFFGYQAGKENIDGHNNVFIGYKSGYNNTGAFLSPKLAADNIFIGVRSGYSNTMGSKNVLIGKSAGQSSENGNLNTIIGTMAGYNATGSANVFLGYQAGYDENNSNRLYIENSNANKDNALIYGEFDNDILAFNADVGIGNSSPYEKLDVYGNLSLSRSFPIPLGGFSFFSSNIFFDTGWKFIGEGLGAVICFQTETGKGDGEIKFMTDYNSRPNQEPANLLTNLVLDVSGSNGFNLNEPINTLDINGTMAIGSDYAGTFNAPDNGLIVQGNVGIGTSKTNQKLNVAGNIQFDNYLIGEFGNIARSTDEWLRLNDGSSHTSGVYIPNLLRADGGLNLGDDEGFYQYGEDIIRTGDGFIIDGNVGIGTTNPLSKLYVNGTGSNGIGIYGNVTAGSIGVAAIWGNAIGSGTQDAKGIVGLVNRNGTGSYHSGYFYSHGTGGTYSGLYADLRTGDAIDIAEYIIDTENNAEPGDVVIADPDNKESILKSGLPFDTRVIGVISTEPHMIMGMELIMDKETGEKYDYINAVQLALVGRVPVKVTDENGPIQIGDFITTSSKPGYGMKWSLLDITKANDFEELKAILAENERRRNTRIGKALEEHTSGTGKIVALISLH